MSDEVRRPNPFTWLRYVYTGSVPARNRAWVMYDATCPTWVLRHIARFLVQLAPAIALVLIFLPAPLTVRIGCAVAAVLGTMAFAFGYIVEGTERRVAKAGYPYGSAAQARERRAIDSQRAVAARNRARREARLSRRTR